MSIETPNSEFSRNTVYLPCLPLIICQRGAPALYATAICSVDPISISSIKLSSSKTKKRAPSPPHFPANSAPSPALKRSQNGGRADPQNSLHRNPNAASKSLRPLVTRKSNKSPPQQNVSNKRSSENTTSAPTYPVAPPSAPNAHPSLPKLSEIEMVPPLRVSLTQTTPSYYPRRRLATHCSTRDITSFLILIFFCIA